MKSNKTSDIYQANQLYWKLYGIWPGNIPPKYYKYYSLIFITMVTVIYNILLGVNLIYTPRNIEALIQEVIYVFTEIAVLSKISTILLMRRKILGLFKSIDCKEFQGDDDVGKDMIKKNNAIYKLGFKVYAAASTFSFCAVVASPLVMYVTFKTELELPIAQYYFLGVDEMDKYFWYCYVYQCAGMYVHMCYNVSVDSFLIGLLLIAITQLRVLKHNFSQLNLDDKRRHGDPKSDQKVNKLLQQYDLILKYCSDVQNVISVVVFVQFCMASMIICTSVCGLLMVQSSSTALYGLVAYFILMTSQIFMPGWLGTQLSYESQELVQAAYNVNWIPQSECLKRSIRLFIGRANKPIVIVGLKIFPLSLTTFIAIIKMAYSIFALIRKMQDRQEKS